MPVAHFTSEEFVCYLFLCLAKADMQLGLDEVNVLFNELELSYFDKADSNQLFTDKVFKLYKQIPEHEHMAIIQKYFPMFLPDKMSRTKVLHQLQRIAMADKNIDTREQHILSAIERLV